MRIERLQAQTQFWILWSVRQSGICCGSGLNFNYRLTVRAFQDRKTCSVWKVLFEGIDVPCRSMEINDGMNSHHFLGREHFIAGDEAGVENVENRKDSEIFCGLRPEKCPPTISIAKEESELGRRTGIKISP